MERKLIRQGGGGYTIYLPKKWVEKNSLEKGQILNLIISGNDLVVSLVPTQKKTETSVKLHNLIESSIRTSITNAYRAGYDRIKVFLTDQKQFKILQKVIKSFL